MTKISKLEEIERPKLTDDQIKEFERELENYKQTAIMANPLEYYGRPLIRQEKFPGYVANEILGGVHWSLVDYCLKNRIIGKHRAGDWFIVAEVYEKGRQGDECKTIAYNEFTRKWQGLKDLRDRRLFASDMEAEKFGEDRTSRIRKILESNRQELSGKMGWE